MLCVVALLFVVLLIVTSSLTYIFAISIAGAAFLIFNNIDDSFTLLKRFIQKTQKLYRKILHSETTFQSKVATSYKESFWEMDRVNKSPSGSFYNWSEKSECFSPIYTSRLLPKYRTFAKATSTPLPNPQATPQPLDQHRYSLLRNNLVKNHNEKESPTKNIPKGWSNLNLSTYADSRSYGLASRIVDYSARAEERENRSIYKASRPFPIVRLFKKELPVVSPKSNKVTVHLAQPDSANYEAEQRRLILQGIMHEKPKTIENKETRSVLDALKEISRKRIHSDDLSDISSGGTETNENTTFSRNSKRTKEDLSFQNDTGRKSSEKKKYDPNIPFVDPITASLTSSDKVFERQLLGQKRKANNDSLEQEKSSKVLKLHSVETQTSTDLLTNQLQNSQKNQNEETNMETSEKDPLPSSQKITKTPPLKIFDDKPLEINRKKRLALLLSTLSGHPYEPDFGNLEEEPSEPVSILSPMSKSKSEKHVTFNETVEIRNIVPQEDSTLQSKNLNAESGISTFTSLTSPPTGLNSNILTPQLTTTTSSTLPPLLTSKIDFSIPNSKDESIKIVATPSEMPIEQPDTTDTSSTFKTGGFKFNLKQSSPPQTTNFISQPVVTPASNSSNFTSLQFNSPSNTANPPQPAASTAVIPKFQFSANTPSSFNKPEESKNSSPQKALVPNFNFQPGTTSTAPPTISFGTTTTSATSISSGTNFKTSPTVPAAFGTNITATTPTTFGTNQIAPNITTPSFGSNLMNSSTTTPSFGTQSFGKSTAETKSTTAAAPPSLFGGNTISTSPLPFSLQTTTPSSFHLGTTASLTSPFGSSVAKPTTTFGTTANNQTTATTTTTSSFSFGTSAPADSKWIFSAGVGGSSVGSASFGTDKTTTKAPSFNFGSSNASTATAASTFGKSSATSTPLGNVTATTATSNTTKTNSFGNIARTTTSSFGGSTVTTSSAFGSDVFGNSSFGSAAKNSQPALFHSSAPSAFSSNTQPAPTFGSNSKSVSAFNPTTQPTSAFGSTSQQASAFGSNNQTTPTFGSKTQQTPTFGSNSQPNPSFGSKTQSNPTFGSNTQTTSAFGSTVSTTSSLFGGQQPQPSTFGTNTQSSAPQFGSNSQTSAPAFGSNNTTTFGSTPQAGFGPSTAQTGFASTNQQTAFGPTTTPQTGFGSTNTQTGFGSSTQTAGFGSAFGPVAQTNFGSSPAQPTFGASTTQSQPGFGTVTTQGTGFGSANQPFGSTQQTSFGASQQPTFGSPNSQTQTGFSASAQPTFGSSAPQSAFGAAPSQQQQQQQQQPFAAPVQQQQQQQQQPFAFGGSNAPTSSGVFSFGSGGNAVPNFSAGSNFGVATPFNAPSFNGPPTNMFSIGSGGSTTPKPRSTMRPRRRV